MALKRGGGNPGNSRNTTPETFRGPTQYPFEALQSSIVGCTEGHRKNVSGPFIVASKAKFANSKTVPRVPKPTPDMPRTQIIEAFRRKS